MKDIICIGRQYGSGGREIGEKIPWAFGIPCCGKLGTDGRIKIIMDGIKEMEGSENE